ncbi:MAG: alpha-amylase [Chitinophagaceae bacterium]|nr:MAG: alpha-amylase [Chitinophagaceae bacterium]
MENAVMLQFFHWYYPADGSLWNKLKEDATELAASGIHSVWLPPAFKANSGEHSVGYDVYDLYDLGEFDQKGTVRTKYGTAEEYIAAVKAAQEAGIKVYADVVVNHMGGADEKELILARKVNPENRNEFLSEPYDIEAFTIFTFPGRKEQYSNFKWDHRCFSGVDYDALKQEAGIFSILNDAGEDWEEMVDDEKGNYDYLMYADVEFRNPAVREELKRWGKWYKEKVGFDGVRLDAVKHISPKFYNEWLDFMRAEFGEDFFAVGEYWAPGALELMERYIAATNGRMSLFDAALHHQFHVASEQGKDFDLSTILNDTLVQSNPMLAVTVVDNHDTQPLQALEAPVALWFKPLAYALILLRKDGYPCLFYPDIYGARYIDKGSDGNDHEIVIDPVPALDKLLWLRKNKAYGEQRDYFDHGNCIGWVREGTSNETGCAVVMSNGEDGFKNMHIGAQHAGKLFINHLDAQAGTVQINEEGWGAFNCKGGTVAVWVAQESLAY